MKDLVPTLLKALGVIALSAFILFLFYPKDRIKDQVVNAALEALGTRLLAMVPKEKEQEVQREFEAMRARALEGQVNEDHLEQFVAVVLNAEAEGKPLPPEKIDSSLAALRHVEVKIRKDERRLRQWAERMHAFEKFETHWQQKFADSGWAMPPPAPPQSFYRIEPNFVVKIDTAALAQVFATRVNVQTRLADSMAVVAARMHRRARLADSLATGRARREPPPLPPHVEIWLKEMSETSRDLPIELEQRYRFAPWPDSLRGYPPVHPPHPAPAVPVTPAVPSANAPRPHP